MRQHRIENGAQALLQFDIEVDGRKYVRADVTCRLVKRDNPSTTHRPCGAPYRRHGVRLMMQNIPADRGVECRALGKSLVRGDHELNLSISGRERPGLRRLDDARFAIARNDAAGLAD